MSFNVYITRKIPDDGISRLRTICDAVEVNPHDRPLTYEELIEQTKGRSALLTMLSDKIDANLIQQTKELKIIANYAVGYDNIDIDAATAKGIVVTNTPGVLTNSTADMAWALLFSAARKIVNGDTLTRTGMFRGWEPMLLLGGDFTGKTLGIIGAGRIGTAVAMRSRGWDMKVLYTTQTSRNSPLEETMNATRVDLDTLLKESDFVSLNTRFSEETRHLIGPRELSKMKPTAYLVNTARGAVIDEVALVEALKNRQIAGAGLDVYEEEPILKPGLAELDNVVLAPHLGSATIETRTKMSLMAADDIIAVINNQRPENAINPNAIEFPF